MVLGHAALELVAVVALAAGVARFLESGMAGFVIGALGGAFLLWIGWGMVRRSPRPA